MNETVLNVIKTDEQLLELNELVELVQCLNIQLKKNCSWVETRYNQSEYCFKLVSLWDGDWRRRFIAKIEKVNTEVASINNKRLKPTENYVA